jgi:hypothetical protein
MKFQTETVAMGVEKSRHFENVIRDEPEGLLRESKRNKELLRF